jgi:hypothetical protein
VPFCDRLATQLTRAKQRGDATTILTIDNLRYHVDLTSGVQVNEATGFRRAVRQGWPEDDSAPAPSLMYDEEEQATAEYLSSELLLGEDGIVDNSGDICDRTENC